MNLLQVIVKQNTEFITHLHLHNNWILSFIEGAGGVKYKNGIDFYQPTLEAYQKNGIESTQVSENWLTTAFHYKFFGGSVWLDQLYMTVCLVFYYHL